MAGTNNLQNAGRLRAMMTAPPKEVVPETGPEMTKFFEGYRDRVYKDSRGYNTIGYGFNIDDPYIASHVPLMVKSGLVPLSQDAANQIYAKLYAKAQQDAVNYVGLDTWKQLSPKKQAILTDMSYNLGEKLGQFKTMRQAIQASDDAGVVNSMKNSRWYKQVGRRSAYHTKNWGK